MNYKSNSNKTGKFASKKDAQKYIRIADKQTKYKFYWNITQYKNKSCDVTYSDPAMETAW